MSHVTRSRSPTPANKTILMRVPSASGLFGTHAWCHEVDSGNDLHVFEPKEFKGGRVKVYGCSPGCLLVSIALSVFLTLAVNSCLHLVG